jgi:hypothetical protein
MAKFDVVFDHHAHFIVSNTPGTITKEDVENKLRELATALRLGGLDAEETLTIVVTELPE